MKIQEKNVFKNWLRKNGFAYNSFAQETGISYNTIAELGSGDNWVPRERIAAMIRKRYRDCPLLRRTLENRPPRA